MKMMMMVPFPLKQEVSCNDLSPTSSDISDKSNIEQYYKLNFIEPVISELRPSPE